MTNEQLAALVDIDPEWIQARTASASALDEVVRLGRLHERDLLVMMAFGAGLTWGATVLRW